MVKKMDTEQLKKIIETNFEKIEEINPQTKGELPEAVNEVINLLDEEEDIDINKLDDPLFYSFFTDEFLKDKITVF